MKKSILLFASLFFILTACKNDTTSQDSKKNNAEISLETKLIEIEEQLGSVSRSNCQNGELTETQVISVDLPSREFVQTAKYCKLEKGYSAYTANFEGHEWAEKSTYYLKDNQLFFAEIIGAAESCEYVHSVHFDSQGNVSKIQVQTNDCEVEADTIEYEVDDADEKNMIMNNVNSTLAKIKKMF